MSYGHSVQAINASFVNLAVAVSQGFFEEEALDVKIQTTQGSLDVVQNLITGEFDVGVPLPESVAPAVADGNDLVLVYNLVRAPTGRVAVLKDSPIQELADLKGKKIGAQSLASGNIPQANALLAEAGLDPESDVEYLAVGLGAQALHAIESGEVDAVVLSDAILAGMENLGAEFRFFELDPSLMATQVVAMRETVENNPELIERFGRAMAKATYFVQVNPEGAIREMWKAFPDTRVAGTSEEEQLANDLHVVNTRWALLTAGLPADGQGWGSYDPAMVEKWIDYAVEAGIVDEPLDAETFFTNEFVEAYNDWDRAEVEAKAKALG